MVYVTYSAHLGKKRGGYHWKCQLTFVNCQEMSIAGNAREQGPESKEKGYQKKKGQKGPENAREKGTERLGYPC
jgi:hypothetical protein